MSRSSSYLFPGRDISPNAAEWNLLCYRGFPQLILYIQHILSIHARNSFLCDSHTIFCDNLSHAIHVHLPPSAIDCIRQRIHSKTQPIVFRRNETATFSLLVKCSLCAAGTDVRICYLLTNTKQTTNKQLAITSTIAIIIISLTAPAIGRLFISAHLLRCCVTHTRPN